MTTTTVTAGNKKSRTARRQWVVMGTSNLHMDSSPRTHLATTSHLLPLAHRTMGTARRIRTLLTILPIMLANQLNNILMMHHMVVMAIAKPTWASHIPVTPTPAMSGTIHRRTTRDRMDGEAGLLRM